MSRRLPRSLPGTLLVLALALATIAVGIVAPAGAPLGATARAATAAYRLYWFKDPSGASFYARWNPCAPVHYRINLAYASPTYAVRVAAARDLDAALRTVTRDTGIRFAFDGYTRSFPQRVGGSFARWKAPAPLTIAWAYPGSGTGRSNILRAGYLGEGGFSVSMTSRGSRWISKIDKGYVVLNASYTRGRTYAPGTVNHKLLLLHELGHAMGLDHYGSTTQVMYPTLLSRRVADYQPGDRSGLARVGRSAGCIR